MNGWKRGELASCRVDWGVCWTGLVQWRIVLLEPCIGFFCLSLSIAEVEGAEAAWNALEARSKPRISVRNRPHVQGNYQGIRRTCLNNTAPRLKRTVFCYRSANTSSIPNEWRASEHIFNSSSPQCGERAPKPRNFNT